MAFGLALWLAAPGAGHPRLLAVLAALVIMAGLATPAVGVERARRILARCEAGGPPRLRLLGGVALGFGLCLAWALMARP